ncbi:MAG: glycosyltransferase family 4 protein [Dysgonamonadaceae bacterium]|jgi:glycosyltransferase involved in cell wall biosynthesis|nr:glycosyltransferase family 4 protein [Dysgonamonadaceae bacterium]
MRIAVTGTRGIPDILGGIETHCEEIFPRIAASGYDVTVIRRKSYTHDQLQDYKGVKLMDIHSPHSKALEAIVHTFRAIHAAKFKLKADVLHVHAVGPALAIPYAKLLGMKVVFTNHGPDYEREKWSWLAKFMLRLGETIGVRFADQIIVISKVINDILRTRYGRSDAHLIYNGISQPHFNNDPDYLRSLKIESRKYILAAGRFVPEKNFDQLIRAFTSVKDKKDYRLVIAGDANIEDIHSIELKQLARKNNVVLTGFIRGDKLHTLLNHASGFVLPSSHEGLPISLLEAMSYRLPAIVSDIPANREVNLAKENYFRVNRETELTEKLQQHILQGYQPVHYDMQQYNWDEIAAQTIEVYRLLK